MRTVLYAKDFEPITIVELPMDILDGLERYGRAILAVADPSNESAENYLELSCERIQWLDGSVKPLIIADDDALALSLRPTWLPGQLQAVHWYQSTVAGLLDTVHKLKKNNLD